jgi:hypothetical protein
MNDYRERTKIAFGMIEAYAKGYLRVAPVSGTRMRLSLQDARNQRPASSTLLRLRDGAHLDSSDLSALIPSIGSVIWLFSEMQAVDGWQLTTIADGIRVTLSMDYADDCAAEQAEAQLRGVAARLVVAVDYGE